MNRAIHKLHTCLAIFRRAASVRTDRLTDRPLGEHYVHLARLVDPCFGQRADRAGHIQQVGVVGREVSAMDRFVMRQPIAETMKARDAIKDVPPSLWMKLGECVPERVGPQTLFVLAREYVAPEPKAELRNDSSWRGRAPEHPDAPSRFCDVLVTAAVEDPVGVVVLGEAAWSADDTLELLRAVRDTPEEHP